MLSPPPSPTTGERKQYSSHDIKNEGENSPPMQRITRPASTNSNHYLAPSGSPLKRMGSLSSENILSDNVMIRECGNETLLMASLPIHARSEMNLTPYSTYGWNNPFQELISTEECYLHDLMDIVDGYLTVLEASAISDPTFDLDLDTLFCNVRDLLNLHLEFLEQLKETEQFRNVAQCFLTRKQQFVNEYTIYCNNYPKACMILKDINLNHNLKILSNFRICQQSLGHMLPLGAYLLKPVQRILKYPLLIKAMLKKAFTVNYKQFATNGYQEMKQALDCMSQVSEEINQMKRKDELTLHINEIQSMLEGWNGLDLNCYGELILEEQLKIKGYRKERHIFLFEKLFLVAKKEEEVYIHPMHIFVENLMLLETPKEGNNFLKVYEHKNPQKYFLLDFSQLSSRKDWVNSIKKLILLSGPAMSENYRKRILEACQTNDDFSHSNDHTSHNKFRDLANITKKRFRISKAKRSHNLPLSQLNSNTDEVPPMLRHSATFSQNNANCLSTDVNRHKRLSDVTDYDLQYFENEIRHSDSSDLSKMSVDSSIDMLSNKGSFPDSILRFTPPSPEYNNNPDMLITNTKNLKNSPPPMEIPNSLSNGSISNEVGNGFNKSPSRKGAIRRKTNTYLQKKLSETFTTTTEDDFGVKAGLNLRRRHTDKEIVPSILDSSRLENNQNSPKHKPKRLEIANNDSGMPPKSPVYMKIRIPTEDNSERKRSRIMNSESPLESKILEFSSPNASNSSSIIERTPSLKLKNNQTLTRNKASRRAPNSTAKKRLVFEDTPFKPDPNIFDKSPKVHLDHYFTDSIGELKFSSVHSVDDCYIGNTNSLINSANKFNTVRPKKSSIKAFFDEKQESMHVKRYNSLPYSCDVTNLFNLFNAATSTPRNENKSNEEKTEVEKEIDLSTSSVFESSTKISQSTEDNECIFGEKTRSPERKGEIVSNLDNFVDSEFDYLHLDDSSLNLTLETPDEDSKNMCEPIANINEVSLENPIENMDTSPTVPNLLITIEPTEFLTESHERNEVVKTHVLLDGPPSDNSDSDSIQGQSCKNSGTLNSPVNSIEVTDLSELSLQNIETNITYPKVTQTSNYHEDTSHENDFEFSNIRNRSQQRTSSTGIQPMEAKHKPEYGTQILQIVFMGSISLLIAIKVLFVVFYSRE